MPLPVKKFFPSVLVADGPGERIEHQHRIVWRGGIQFGQRRKAVFCKLYRVHPPMAVIQSPGFTVLTRARIAACTSAIEAAVSSRVSWPGRKPSRRKWLWLSTSPGMAVRPPRLITCMQGPPLGSPSLPTAVIFPSWIVDGRHD